MNQVFVGGIALIITLILWGSKKQLKLSPFSQSQKDSFPNESSASSLVQKTSIIKPTKNKSKKHIKSISLSKRPLNNSIETEKQLNKLISGGPNDRLLAIQIASQWGSKKAIPFLKRGLKDFDSRVVIASASAITTYKGKIVYSQKKSQTSRPPRNVSLMR